MILTAQQIDMFYRCGVQWENRYVREIIIPPVGVTLAYRGALKAVIPALERKLDGEDMSLEEAEQMAQDGARAAIDDCGGEYTEEPGDEGAEGIEDRAVKMARLHHRSLLPNVNPVRVKREYRLNLSGYDTEISGTVDVQEDISGEVFDNEHAVSSLIMHRPRLRQQEVLTAADSATDIVLGHLALSQIDGQGPELGIVQGLSPAKTSVTEAPKEKSDHERLLLRIGMMSNLVDKGIAMPAPSGAWYCSKEWCGYWSRCPYGQRGQNKQKD